MSRISEEARLLFRDTSARLILIGWVILLGYACFVGVSAVEALRADQLRFVEEAAAERAAQRERMLAVESGAAAADPYVGFPSMLRSPAVMPISALAALDVGVLDRSTLTLRLSLFSGPQQAGKGKELQSPLLLSAGRFDLGFVAVVLLPLALIALLFAQPGDDRGGGRLPLISAQGALHGLYLRRYLLRTAALVLPLAAFSGLGVVLASEGSPPLSAWAVWLLPMLGWASLWAGASAFVASRSTTAAAALAWLVALWVGLLWLLPAAIDTLAARAAPTPSALSLLGAERRAAQEAQTRREELFGSYVSDHPELSVQTTQDALAWTRSYYVQQQFIAEAMAGPRANAQAMQARQRALRERLMWVSPAQALTTVSERSAGSDAQAHARFMAKADAHKKAWDEALFRPLLAARGISTDELERLPQFTPLSFAPVAGLALVLCLQLIVIAGVLWLAARWRAIGDER